MGYFDSKGVTVFPSVYRTLFTDGKFTSEQNFINILNSITDIDSYVLNSESNINQLSEQATLKVVIHGYYFEISAKSLPQSKGNLYLAILVENADTSGKSLVDYENTKTTSLDSGGVFKGLFYNNSKPSKSEENYSHYFLQVTDNSGNLINKVRLKADSIEYADGQSVTAELDSKQDTLKTTTNSGIFIKENNEISIANGDGEGVNKTPNYKDRLDSLIDVGSGINPIYFNSNGLATPSSANVGKVYESTTY